MGDPFPSGFPLQLWPGAASLAPAFKPCSAPRTMNGELSWQPGPGPEAAGCPSGPLGSHGGMGAELRVWCVQAERLLREDK